MATSSTAAQLAAASTALKKAAPAKAAPAKKTPAAAPSTTKAASKPAARAAPAPAKKPVAKAPAKAEAKRGSAITLTLVPKGTYATEREEREDTVAGRDKALKSMLAAVKKKGVPMPVSDFDVPGRIARGAAKHGFRQGAVRLYKGDDRRMYVGLTEGPAAKSVEATASRRPRSATPIDDDDLI